MRTASQILARHCPVPHLYPKTDESDSDLEYFVPMEDALAAIRDAIGEADRKPDLSIHQAFGKALMTLVLAPLIFIIAGFGAVFDNFESIIARVRLSNR
jgi:hypothetical protein